MKKQKRNLFAELSEGLEALALAREGKLTLRTHEVEIPPPAHITAQELIALRQRLQQLTQSNWLTGQLDANGRADVRWWHPDGREMAKNDWATPLDTLGMCLALTGGSPLTVCAIFHRGASQARVKLPPGTWKQILASASQSPFVEQNWHDDTPIDAHAVHLFVQPAIS